MADEGNTGEAPRRHLAVGDWAGILAAIIAIPPLLDWAIARLTPPEIEIIYPRSITIRSNLQGHWNGECDAHIASPQAERPASCRTSRDIKDSLKRRALFIAPLSYFNTGDRGEVVQVISERLILNNPGGERIGTWEAALDTAIAPSNRQHWWLGDVEPWLATSLGGLAERQHEVVFAPLENACEGCKYGELLDILPENVEVKFEIETADGQVFQSAPCHVELEELGGTHFDWKENPAKFTQPDDARSIFRHAARCRPPS